MLARQSTDVSGEAASGTVPSISTSRCCAVRWAAAGALTLPATPTIRWAGSMAADTDGARNPIGAASF